MMRIALFLLTNLAVIAVASITLSLLGVNSYFVQSGSGLDLTNLLIFCAVFGFAGALISLFLSKTMAKMSTRTHIITQAHNEHQLWLLRTVKELADKAGIGMPEVGVFPSQQANAFATGWNKNSALVAVSEGLLNRFEKDEIRAVLAHEIGHVANGDMVTLSLIQGVVNTFVLFAARVVGFFVDSYLRRGNDNSGVGFGYYIAVFIAEIIFGIAASAIVMWFSRFREFRADEAGARLAGKRSMIAALQRLQMESRGPANPASDMPDTISAFGIRTGSKQGLKALFASHPPLEERIAALQRQP